MPTISTGNTNAPTIMIGEKAADLIKASNRVLTQVPLATGVDAKRLVTRHRSA